MCGVNPAGCTGVPATACRAAAEPYRVRRNNLAVGLAQAGKRVVLVACDFRKPTTHQFFGVRNQIGLSDVLTGQRTLKAALQRPIDDLDLLVLTSGKIPPNPSELLGSEKMRDLLEQLKETADWVIIDTPPLLAVADGVLLVTKGGASTREAVRHAGEMVTNAGGRLIGAVVWGLEGFGGRGGYGYRTSYGYGGYYSYADYYNTPEETEASAPAHRSTGSASTVYIPPKSAGRTIAEGVGRVVGVVLAVLAVAALVVYFLDQAMGWGIVAGVFG